LQNFFSPALIFFNAGDAYKATTVKRNKYLIMGACVRTVRYCMDMLSVNDRMRQALKLRQYLPDNHRVFDANDDFHAAAADTTRFVVEIEHPPAGRAASGQDALALSSRQRR
jgi:hypothetical protein